MGLAFRNGACFAHSVGIQYVHQLAIQLMHADDHRPHLPTHRFRRWLKSFAIAVDDIAYVVHKQVTEPSGVRTTTQIGDTPSARAVSRKRLRRSMATTIWPRRFINPLTDGGASGTLVKSRKRMTS